MALPADTEPVIETFTHEVSIFLTRSAPRASVQKTIVAIDPPPASSESTPPDPVAESSQAPTVSATEGRSGASFASGRSIFALQAPRVRLRAMLSTMVAHSERFRMHVDTPSEDHIVQLHDASWEDYERLLAIRGDKSAPRITYLEGTLQIMSPSRDHESIKTLLGRLLEAWCADHGVELMAFGSWTIKERQDERGVEADECYIFGTERRNRPDLAIEVEWTRGGLNKLEVYHKLGIAEVWRWRKGVLQVHLLRGDEYIEAPRSALLPDLDLALLASFADRPTITQAIRDYRAALAG